MWRRQPKVAEAIEEALDWIEADPPNPTAKRRRFANGMWNITTTTGYEDCLIVGEEPTPNRPVIRHIGESTSL